MGSVVSISGIDCCFVVQAIVITNNDDSRNGITFVPTCDGSDERVISDAYLS